MVLTPHQPPTFHQSLIPTIKSERKTVCFPRGRGSLKKLFVLSCENCIPTGFENDFCLSFFSTIIYAAALLLFAQVTPPTRVSTPRSSISYCFAWFLFYQPPSPHQVFRGPPPLSRRKVCSPRDSEQVLPRAARVPGFGAVRAARGVGATAQGGSGGWRVGWSSCSRPGGSTRGKRGGAVDVP